MDTVPHKAVCPATLGFVRNQWYAIAFSHEVGRDKPLHRICCGEPMALYRTQAGEAVALFDRCPHRGVPLSYGRIVGDAVQCAYHGFQFDASGACVCVPSQDYIPPELAVPSYTLVERSHFIWVWIGDKDKCDPALLPDHHELGLDRAGWQAKPYFVLEIASNYSLLFENLLDTSHISYLHGRALDSGRMALATFRTEHDANTVQIVRDLKGDTPNPSNAKQYGLAAGVTFDRELRSIAHLPNLHVIRNTFTFPSQPGHAAHVRINIMPITPATQNSHYQFLSLSASYPEEHPQSLIDAMHSVFEEDRAVLEAIQRLYDERGPDLAEYSVNADGAGLRARRRLAALAEAPS